MGSKKTKQTSNETATTSTALPSFATAPIANYFDMVNGLTQKDPNSFVSGPNALQSQAYGGAMGMNRGNAMGGAIQATSSLFGGQRGLNLNGGGLSSVIASQGNAARVSPTMMGGYFASAPDSIGAAKVQGVAAPTVTQAQMGDAPRLMMTQSAPLESQAQGAGGASMLSNLSAYMNPYLKDYVDATLANFDDYSGRQQAAYRAQGARNGAFGGSRFGIGEAQMASDMARQRGLTESELRSQAFDKASTNASSDADRFTQANIASAQMANNRLEKIADLEQQARLANMGAANNWGMSIFDAINQGNRFNASEANDLASQVYGANMDNARQDAASQNDLARLIYGTQADMSKFNASNAFDANKTNANFANQFALDNAQRGDAMQQFNMNYGLNRDRMGLDAANQYANMWNMAQANDRANIGLQGDLGNQLWQIQNQQAQAPMQYANGLQGLLDPALLDLFGTKTINTQGTSTSKQSGGLLEGVLGGLFNIGAAAV